MGANIKVLIKLTRSSIQKKGLRFVFSSAFLLASASHKSKTVLNSTKKNPITTSNFGYGIIVSDCSLPQCVYYRVTQKVELFQSQNIRIDVLNPYSITKILSDLRIASFIIIYRSTPIGKLRKIIRESKKYGVKVFYELDDLIFSRKLLAKDENFKRLPIVIRYGIIKDSYRHQYLIRKSDACISSTEDLSHEMMKAGAKDVFTFPNVISNNQVALTERIRRIRPKLPGEFIDIYWPSGSISHFENFRAISPAIVRLMNEDRRVRLKTHTDINDIPTFRHLSSQIQVLDWLPYETYLLEVAKSRVVINPLLENRFNRSKSPIKELESALLATSFVGPAPVYTSFFQTSNESEELYNTLYKVLYLEYNQELEEKYQKNLVSSAILMGQELPHNFLNFLKEI